MKPLTLIMSLALTIISITACNLDKSFEPTNTPTPTQTPVPVTVEGTVFLDMNGNGIHDQAFRSGDLTEHPDGQLGAIGPIEEPIVADAVITIGNVSTKSAADGMYHIKLPPGHYEVKIEKQPYRFLFPSVNEVLDLNKSFPVDITENTVLDFGLGVGLFTLPYSLDENESVRFEQFTDINPLTGESGTYNSYPCNEWYGNDDGHRGIDYYMPSGSIARAIAPGFIYSVGKSDDGSLMIVEVYTEYEDLVPWTYDDRIHWSWVGLESSYQHLAEPIDGIKPGVFVKRGQPLAYISSHNHLHIDAHLGNWETGGWIDLFKDTFHNQLVFLFHQNENAKISQGSPGYWTVENQPYFWNNIMIDR